MAQDSALPEAYRLPDGAKRGPTVDQPPRCVFISHGEERAAISFAQILREKTGWTVKVPEYRETYELG